MRCMQSLHVMPKVPAHPVPLCQCPKLHSIKLSTSSKGLPMMQEDSESNSVDECVMIMKQVDGTGTAETLTHGHVGMLLDAHVWL